MTVVCGSHRNCCDRLSLFILPGSCYKPQAYLGTLQFVHETDLYSMWLQFLAQGNRRVNNGLLGLQPATPQLQVKCSRLSFDNDSFLVP